MAEAVEISLTTCPLPIRGRLLLQPRLPVGDNRQGRSGSGGFPPGRNVHEESLPIVGDRKAEVRGSACTEQRLRGTGLKRRPVDPHRHGHELLTRIDVVQFLPVAPPNRVASTRC